MTLFSMLFYRGALRAGPDTCFSGAAGPVTAQVTDIEDARRTPSIFFLKT